MLDLSNLNYWAIAVTWLVYVIIGAYWYSPAGFAKLWTKYTKIDILKMPQKAANNAIIAVALSTVVQVFTLAIVINSLGINDALHGFIAGFVLWLGLTTATTVGVTLYSRRSWKFLWLNSSYFLLVMSIGAIILAVWK